LERPAEELLPSTGVKVLRVPNEESAREPELPAGGMEEGLDLVFEPVAVREGAVRREVHG